MIVSGSDVGILIHYGSSQFHHEKFQTIKNYRVKPKGGLWTSPIQTEWGWKEWCLAESFRTEFDTYFTLTLQEKSLVYQIDRLADLNDLIWYTYPPYQFEYPNYEAMANTYDAIWLTDTGEKETRYTIQRNLYGWDCESVLILNPMAIQPAVAEVSS